MSRVIPETPPSGEGCLECENAGGWWVHLRRCATCGHIGCCDTSLGRHATAHFHDTDHEIVRSFEPGESWFWSYRTEQMVAAQELVAPSHHPLSQPAPGPRGRVPVDWRALIEERDRIEHQ